MSETVSSDRAQRILNAAADLIVRYGYDKTTISDIAREAGISKGAVYLHFESKDALFEALFIRELESYAETWLAGIAADPQGGTIAAMYKQSLYALEANPFMAAMFRQDRHVFGNYLRKPGNFFAGRQFKSTRADFIKLMQEAGAVRQDLDPHVTAHIMNILAYGLVAMDEIMVPSEIPPMSALIEGIGDFMDRALRPPSGGNDAAGKAIIQQMADAARQQHHTPTQPQEE